MFNWYDFLYRKSTGRKIAEEANRRETREGFTYYFLYEETLPYSDVVHFFFGLSPTTETVFRVHINISRDEPSAIDYGALQILNFYSTDEEVEPGKYLGRFKGEMRPLYDFCEDLIRDYISYPKISNTYSRNNTTTVHLENNITIMFLFYHKTPSVVTLLYNGKNCEDISLPHIIEDLFLPEEYETLMKLLKSRINRYLARKS